MTECENEDTVAATVRTIVAAWQPCGYTEMVEEALQDDGGHEEAQELGSLLRGKAWDEVPETVLLADCPSPWILNGRAFCYYMPALLIATLDHPNELAPRLLGALEVPKKPRALSRFMERFAYLSPEQVQAVACTLRVLRTIVSEDVDWVSRRVDLSLGRFWSQEAADSG